MTAVALTGGAETGAATTEVAAGVVARRLADIRDRMARAGADPASVRIVAVTKGFGAEAVSAALACGLADVGESYAQELLGKAPAVVAGPVPLRWHFLGQVQRNKVKAIVALVDTWHGIDRLAEAEAVLQGTGRQGTGHMLVQVLPAGTDPLSTRGGCSPDEARDLVARIRDAGMEVAGLSTVAPRHDPDGAGRWFAQVRSLADDLGLAQCSMGMTDDFETAVARGSTTVRIGRGLFGNRPSREDPGRPPPR